MADVAHYAPPRGKNKKGKKVIMMDLSLKINSRTFCTDKYNSQEITTS